MARLWLFVAALLGAAAVAAGAATATGAGGSHDFDVQLRERGLDDATVAQQLHRAGTAVQYHLIHAVAMFGAGLLAWSARSVFAHLAAFAFLLGIVLFSGSLYALVFADLDQVKMLVPIGGVSLMVGWVLLALGGLFAGHRYEVVEAVRRTMNDRA